MKTEEETQKCWMCGGIEGQHIQPCEMATLGMETSFEKGRPKAMAQPERRITNRGRRLKGSINLKADDRKSIQQDAQRIVEIYSRGDLDALLLEAVHFTAANIAYLKWLRDHPPEGRANTQALLSGLNEAREQLIELVGMLKERENGQGKSTGAGKGKPARTKRRVSGAKRSR